jgi:hypothetical protein
MKPKENMVSMVILKYHSRELALKYHFYAEIPLFSSNRFAGIS